MKLLKEATQKPPLSKKEAQVVIDHLQGSCMSLEQACEDCEVDVDEFYKNYVDMLDEQHFNCEVCGWWCEVGDYGHDSHGREICTDCEEESNEDC